MLAHSMNCNNSNLCIWTIDFLVRDFSLTKINQKMREEMLNQRVTLVPLRSTG